MSDRPFRSGMLVFPNLTQLDLTILPSATFDSRGKLDLVLVPGGAGINPLLEDAETLAFLSRDRAERVARAAAAL